LAIERPDGRPCGIHTTTGLRACFFAPKKSSQVTFGVAAKSLIYNNFFPFDITAKYALSH
jgi:hypothetical protein